MPYDIRYTANATQFLDVLATRERVRIVKKIDVLAKTPYPPGCRALSGFSGFHRIRVGEYRVIYSVHKEVVTVVIATIGNRRDVYAKFKRLFRSR